MITTRLTTTHSTRWCAGCGAHIPPGTKRLEHELPGLPMEVLTECLACAARNGRPGYAEPDVPEQPLSLEGVGA